MSDVVLTEQRGRVRVITFNRPDRLNAWTATLGRAYFDALDAAAADADVRAIVVTGAGRGFCAGADMDTLQGISAGERDGAPDTRPHSYATTIPKPVVAAVNGACAGLGMVHALMADIRFAARGAKFTTAFARRGLIGEHGISWVLPRLVGPSRALDLLMSGRVILAEEAHEMGLVNRLCEPDQVLDEAVVYAEDLGTYSAPMSMKVMKYQVWNHLEMGLDEALADSNGLMVESLRRPDFKEGVQSFVDKRDPDFAPVTG
jgi:enoyl-CoA hydratase/carnithine racemase